jgi:transcriptional regulator with XRE-family HTH domain
METTEKLKLIRKHFNMNQKEFSEKIGVQASYYSDLENGKREITTRIINSLIVIFQVSADWFLTGNGNIQFTKSNEFLKGENEGLSEGFNEKNEGLSSKNLETDYLIIKANELITDLENRIQVLESEVEKIIFPRDLTGLYDGINDNYSKEERVLITRQRLLNAEIRELWKERNEIEDKLQNGDLNFIRTKLLTKNKKNKYNEKIQIIGNQSVSEISATQLDEMIKDKLSYMDFFLIGILYHVRTHLERKKGNPFNDTWYDKQRAYIKQYEGDVFSKKPASYTKMSIKEKFELIKELDEAIRGLLNMIWDMSVQIYSENAT